MSDSSKAEFVDYYQLLSIEHGSDRAQIRDAFLRLAKQHHPDIGGSAEHMQQLNTAYKTLMSSSTKGAYDLLHSFHTGKTKPEEYKYSERRQVHDVTDMEDAEIDSFLDSLLSEYRNGPPKSKQTIKQRLKKFFEI